MNRLLARLLAPTLAAAVLFVPAVAQAKPAAPKATAPKVGTTVQNMPAMTWNAAKGAVQYEVQIASDSGFNPALIDVTTQNLRFVNAKMLPNGAYFWRVRSIDADNDSSKWSGVRKFTKKWNAVAALLTPASLNTISYPNPAILTWAPVPGAVTYRVSVASGAAGGGVDAPGGVISKGALAWNDNGNPITTVEHEPRRLGVAAPGHVLLAGRAGRRRGQCRRAVPDLLVRVALARHDHADGHRHGAGRGDLRPALPVGPDSGRRELRDGDQHDLGLRDRLQALLRQRPRDVLRPDRDAAEQHVLLARPRPRLAGPGRPLEQWPDVRQDL